MATPLVGTGGSVTFTTQGGVIARTWNAAVSRATIDITAFGNWGRSRTAGIMDITGSVTGTLDGAATPLTWATNTAAATVTLQADSGNTLAFPAIVENANLSVDVAAAADVTYNFALSAATTTATSFSLTAAGLTATWTS